MLEERCFICGGRMSRGMQLSLGPQERMDKLVSVSRTLSHTSTIICDILSRILNETVLKDEIICKICFNLLNDIDYHLKEAQVRQIFIFTRLRCLGTFKTAKRTEFNRNRSTINDICFNATICI